MTAPGQTEGAVGAGVEAGAPHSQAELRADIEQTRERLGDTVQALMARADLRARARERAGAVTALVGSRAVGIQRTVAGPSSRRIEVAVMAVSAAVLVAVSVALVLRRPHRRH
jgi:hypothetical protein